MTVLRIAVAALACLLVAGCEPQPSTINSFSGPLDAPRVVVFGDSLTTWAGAAAVPLFDAWQLSYNSVPGTTVADWFAPLPEVPSDAIVVMALGTNDARTQTMAETRADVDTALASLAHVRCVVWVTPSQYSAVARGWPYDVRTHDLDEYLRSLTVPNLVLAEWSVAANGHPEYLTGDLVHHTDAGNQAYAQILAAAPGECPA
jgi:hypothetical protein